MAGSLPVAVVFQEDASALLPKLMSHRHVWLAASPQNCKLAQHAWAEQRAGCELTTFARGKQPADAALQGALELVDEHHGGYEDSPPDVIIFGLDPTAAVIDTLRAWGYSQIETGSGIRATAALSLLPP